MTDKLEFLQQHPIFKHLYEDELLALAEISEEYEFDQGAVIAYQRDMADSLYMVKSGRIFARTVDERGIVRDSQPYGKDSYFGDVWLFAPGAHPATVNATEPGRLIMIPGGRFLQFLERFPGALEALKPEYDTSGQHISGLTPEAWAEAQKSRIKADKQSAAVNLLADELVELHLRRSRWYLYLRLLPPAVGLLGSLYWAVFFSAGWGALQWISPLLLILLFGAWLAFHYMDWSNDYFVITNKHLVHREFSLRTFRRTVIKIPIDQIQSVAIVRPSLIANLFDIGTARITTAAQAAAIYFDNIDNPRQVEDVLNRLRQQVKQLDAARAQTTMRRSVEGHFQVDPGYGVVADAEDGDFDEDEAVPETAVSQPITFASLWAAFKRRYQGRVEEGDVITYRKHFFVLFKVTGWPLLALLLLILGNWVVIIIFRFTWRELALVDAILFLLVFGWLTWQVEDWRNDTFQLTSRYVIDIDRRPFGFGESRKQAELSNVQNINSDRPNFLATIFNYGNVVIDTAGAQADIVFENVSNPNRIQSDIFKRRDQYRRQQMIRQGEQRRKEYAVLLDVYKQATEQGRIPRRTPED